MKMIEEVEKLVIESAAVSDPGRRRSLNQDAIFHKINQAGSAKSAGLFLVCDGMGGKQGGEIASQIAVDTIAAEFSSLLTESTALTGDTQPSFYTLDQKLMAAFEKANTGIRQYAQDHLDETPHLGTTATAVLIYGHQAHIINVGDGRVYVSRSGRLFQVTEDHSLAAVLAQKGVINEAAIATHPQNHIILRALGVKESVQLDVFDWELLPGDILLLCSDGLWKAFPDSSELGRRLQADAPTSILCRGLVTEAIERDGSDNISAIVVKVSAAKEV